MKHARSGKLFIKTPLLEVIVYADGVRQVRLPAVLHFNGTDFRKEICQLFERCGHKHLGEKEK